MLCDDSFEKSNVGKTFVRERSSTCSFTPADLLDQLAIVLHLDSDQIRQLQEQDRVAAAEWLRKISDPMRPHLGLRTVPWPSLAHIPEEVISWGPDAIEDYAIEFARSNGFEVHVMLNHRIRLVIDRRGELVEIREAGRDDEFKN